MLTSDTIAAISTPIGHSGIGIVRLSGKDAIPITGSIFISPKKRHLRQARSHSILYGHIIDSNQKIIDEVLVSVMKAPQTYTKEDIVEINCHGGPLPLRKILELVLKAGARLAQPGEFTQRAFIHGRIDLAQAEAVLDIINAMTEESQRIAVEQLRGSLSQTLIPLREELLQLTAYVEACIDFPEEDISLPSLRDMKQRASKIKGSLENFINSSRYGIILREGIKTAIVGKPNVGKSSLLNALLEHDRAIVTEMPGTTRDVIEEYLNIQGIPVKIMDTAGIREVKNIAEKEGVKRSLKAMKDADLVIIVLDGSKGMSGADRELIENSKSLRGSQSQRKNIIIVINKTDLPQKIKMKKDMQTVKVSALKRTGLETLKSRIAETVLNGKSPGLSETGIVTNVRHVHALEKTLSSMNSFICEVGKKTSPEFLAVDLREALEALGEILGITTPDDILDTIFSNFCIGK
ncbi:tRNA uridine-5-carboxymethylaminomethyl(34) synthesis GTPase MnmE [bacterium]|nr:MAG: tRNA uridine-5-carboxymethylaminomethyl(34) synthesis GTPase MnmE [bacterium]